MPSGSQSHHLRSPSPGESPLNGPVATSHHLHPERTVGGGAQTTTTAVAAAATPDSKIFPAAAYDDADSGVVVGVDWSHLTVNKPTAATATMMATMPGGVGAAPRVVTQTPTTQASSPSPSFTGTNTGGDDDEHIDELIAATATTTEEEDPKAAAGEEEERRDDDDDYFYSQGQGLSQGDQHVYDADRSGSLNEVVGSQSMLSQEILGSSSAGGGCTQDTLDDEDVDGDGEGDGDDAGKKKKEKNVPFSMDNLILSQESETSYGMARRLGLLSQTSQDSVDDPAPAVASNDVGNVHAVGHNHNDPASSAVAVSTSTAVTTSTSASSEVNPPLTPISSKFLGKDISDTPVRQSENFGSLLDAVAKITEEEEVNLKLASSWRTGGGSSGGLFGTAAPARKTGKKGSLPTGPVLSTSGKTGSSARASIRRRKPSAKQLDSQLPESHLPNLDEGHQPQSSRNKRKNSSRDNETKKMKVETSSASGKKILDLTSPRVAIHQTKKTPPSSSTTKTKPKARVTTMTQKELKEAQILKDQRIAQRAAALAERTITDPLIAKKLLLSMALVRENPRNAPEMEPEPGFVLRNKFIWSHYPCLEAILKEHMAEYYRLSTEKCQSAHQQAFNNGMVVVMKDAVKAKGWSFDSCFDDKTLRDRIRCYYKTHIQNAKKRLRTMVQNPTKRANARHLVEHLDLIEGTSTEDLQSVPEPIRPRQEPPKPMKKAAEAPARQVVAPPVRQMTQSPAPVRPQKVEITKKTKTKTLTKKQEEEDDVLAKVNLVIPPFSPCRERVRREEV